MIDYEPIFLKLWVGRLSQRWTGADGMFTERETKRVMPLPGRRVRRIPSTAGPAQRRFEALQAFALRDQTTVGKHP